MTYICGTLLAPHSILEILFIQLWKYTSELILNLYYHDLKIVNVLFWSLNFFFPKNHKVHL